MSAKICSSGKGRRYDQRLGGSAAPKLPGGRSPAATTVCAATLVTWSFDCLDSTLKYQELSNLSIHPEVEAFLSQKMPPRITNNPRAARLPLHLPTGRGIHWILRIHLQLHCGCLVRFVVSLDSFQVLQTFGCVLLLPSLAPAMGFSVVFPSHKWVSRC